MPRKFQLIREPLMPQFTDACMTPFMHASSNFMRFSDCDDYKPTWQFIGTKHTPEEQGDES